MAENELIFTIPLRKKFGIYPPWRRVRVAVRTTRSFLFKHLKTTDVKLGKYLNLKLHEHGRKRPPHHIQVKVWKEKDVYHAELINAPIEKAPEKKEAKPESRPEAKAAEVTKEETKKEALEEERKEVLKHPEEKEVKKEKPEVKRKVKGAQKAGEMTRKKEIFSKTQKPKHEKKK